MSGIRWSAKAQEALVASARGRDRRERFGDWLTTYATEQAEQEPLSLDEMYTVVAPNTTYRSHGMP